MSLKNDIEMVKEELSSEEKFFEKAVVTEKFVKKYKKLIIGSVVAIVIVVVADIGYEANKQHTLNLANETLASLEKNPKDTIQADKLRTLSPQLHDVWLYSQAIVDNDIKILEELKSSKANFVGDLSFYEAAQRSDDKSQLESYSQKQGAVYKDLAQVQLAVLLMNEGKIDEAHEKLNMVNINSPLAQLSQALMHYGVK